MQTQADGEGRFFIKYDTLDGLKKKGPFRTRKEAEGAARSFVPSLLKAEVRRALMWGEPLFGVGDLFFTIIDSKTGDESQVEYVAQPGEVDALVKIYREQLHPEDNSPMKTEASSIRSTYRRCVEVVARFHGKVPQALVDAVGGGSLVLARRMLDGYLERQGLPKTASSWARLEKTAAKKVGEWRQVKVVAMGSHNPIAPALRRLAKRLATGVGLDRDETDAALRLLVATAKAAERPLPDDRFVRRLRGIAETATAKRAKTADTVDDVLDKIRRHSADGSEQLRLANELAAEVDAGGPGAAAAMHDLEQMADDIEARGGRTGSRKTAIVKRCREGDGEEGKPYCLYSHEGKLLGRHATEEDAYKQEAAIRARTGSKPPEHQPHPGSSEPEWSRRMRPLTDEERRKQWEVNKPTKKPSEEPSEKSGERIGGLHKQGGHGGLSKHAGHGFIEGYFEAALWSSTDENGVPLDRDYTEDDIEQMTAHQMRADCQSFQQDHADLLARSGLDDAKAGHDFWLSRNGHGAGFFDENLGEVGEKLQEASKAYGEYDLQVEVTENADGESVATIYGPTHN